MNTRTAALFPVLLALAALPACEQSNSPDAVSAPAHEDHEGHDHADGAHDDHDHAGDTHQDHTPSSADRIYAADFSVAIPAGWIQHPPSNSMRLTELVAPLPEGAPSGTERAVAAFSLAGGDMKIDRWKGQFSEADATRSEETRQLAGTTVHLVEMAGSYMGMGNSPAAGKTVMRAAIVERPGQPNLFIKMTGPASVMDATTEDWNAMINSLTSP